MVFKKKKKKKKNRQSRFTFLIIKLQPQFEIREQISKTEVRFKKGKYISQFLQFYVTLNPNHLIHSRRPRLFRSTLSCQSVSTWAIGNMRVEQIKVNFCVIKLNQSHCSCLLSFLVNSPHMFLVEKSLNTLCFDSEVDRY